MPVFCNCQSQLCKEKNHKKGKRCANRVAGGARNKLCGGCVDGTTDSTACPSSPKTPPEMKQSQADKRADRRKPAHNESSPTPRTRPAAELPTAESEAGPALPKRPRIATEPRGAGIAATKAKPGLSKERRATSEKVSPLDVRGGLLRRLEKCSVRGDLLTLVGWYLDELTDKAQETLPEEEVWQFGRQLTILCGKFAAKARSPLDEFLARHSVSWREFVAALGHLSAAFVADPVDGTAGSSSKVGPAENFKAWCLTALNCEKRKVAKVGYWILNVIECSAYAGAEAGAASSA